MIRALNVVDPMRACTPWWGEVPELKDRARIDFKPGLNILWGPNGSGKSTILKALARMLHCEQGGVQVVTDTSYQEVMGNRFRRGGASIEGYCDGLVPDHDGQPVLYFDPGAMVGLIGGGAAFDWDFSDMGFRNTMFRGSAGQLTMMRSEAAVLAAFRDDPIPAVQWKRSPPVPAGDRPDSLEMEWATGTARPPKSNWEVERWERRAEDVRRWHAIEATLAGTGENTGIPTLILDEPDRSLDVPIQASYWMRMAMVGAEKRQIIAATHSVFALGVPGAHYIELREGYLERSVQAMERHRKLCKAVRTAAIHEAIKTLDEELERRKGAEE